VTTPAPAVRSRRTTRHRPALGTRPAAGSPCRTNEVEVVAASCEPGLLQWRFPLRSVPTARPHAPRCSPPGCFRPTYWSASTRPAGRPSTIAARVHLPTLRVTGHRGEGLWSVSARVGPVAGGAAGTGGARRSVALSPSCCRPH
jgi:hypothetical protein